MLVRHYFFVYFLVSAILVQPFEFKRETSIGEKIFFDFSEAPLLISGGTEKRVNASDPGKVNIQKRFKGSQFRSQRGLTNHTRKNKLSTPSNIAKFESSSQRTPRAPHPVIDNFTEENIKAYIKKIGLNSAQMSEMSKRFRLNYNESLEIGCELMPLILQLPNDKISYPNPIFGNMTRSWRPINSTMYAWAHCRQAFRPFFYTQLTGSIRIAGSVTLISEVGEMRIFEMSWPLSHQVVADIVIDVRYWSDFSTFSPQQACQNLRGPAPQPPTKHISGSPMSIKIEREIVNNFSFSEMLPLCTSEFPPQGGVWVRRRFEGDERTALNRTMFDPAEIIVPVLHQNGSINSFFNSTTGTQCGPKVKSDCGVMGLKAFPTSAFAFSWTPRECRLRDFNPNEFIDDLVSKFPARVKLVHMHFAGDSTLFYLCKTWATLLSGHTLRLHPAKFSSHMDHEPPRKYESFLGNGIVVNCIKGANTEIPLGQASFLKKRLNVETNKNILKNTSTARIFVIGDSNAHSLCHGNAEGKVSDGTKALINLMKQVNKNPLSREMTKFVWFGPVYVSRAYTLVAEDLSQKQIALWRSELNLGAILIEQMKISQPFTFSESEDGLHYHKALRFDDLSRCVCGFNNHGRFSSVSKGGEKSRFSGPVVISALKVMANLLVNPLSEVTS